MKNQKRVRRRLSAEIKPSVTENQCSQSVTQESDPISGQMNSKEVQQAILDYNNSLFGNLRQ